MRARRLRISISGEGKVLITKPFWISSAKIENLIREKMDWIQSKVAEFNKRPKKILQHHSLKDYKENKKKAHALATEHLLYFNQFYNHQIGQVCIRNQKTRWGSCSGKGNISFNYKIVFLPRELQEYLVVHELCHLKEMNHSKNFWNLVGQKIPDYKEKRAKIKLY
jgi:predicted metal-dependent hydrolase